MIGFRAHGMAEVIELRPQSVTPVVGVTPEYAAFCRSRQEMLRRFGPLLATGVSPADVMGEIDATRHALEQLAELERVG